MQDTFTSLNKAGILYAGAGMTEKDAFKPVYFEKNEIKFALLAYNDSSVVSPYYCAEGETSGTACMDIEKLKNGIKEAKKNADLVIVSMHAGTEYTEEANDQQVEFAHTAIDAGAGLVIGTHPHAVENAEIYKGKYIFYSLGNFVFDQMWSRQTQEGLMIKMVLDKNGLVSFEPTAILIEDYSQPRILEGEEAKVIIDRLKISLQ